MDISVACCLGFCKIQQRNAAGTSWSRKNLDCKKLALVSCNDAKRIKALCSLMLWLQRDKIKRSVTQDKIPYQKEQKYFMFQTQKQINFGDLRHKSGGGKIGSANECHPRPSNQYIVFLAQQQQNKYLSLKLTFLQTVFDQLKHKESGNRRSN